MNILPKKRWHVRTKENIARVRRDEALAAEQAKIEQARIDKAESEARLKFLRNESRQKKDILISDSIESESISNICIQSSSKHINFFEELEQGNIDHTKTNKDHEKEKKEEQEKYEKQIGLLTYLGQGIKEAVSKSWYNELPKRINDSEKNIEIKPNKKSLEDPMQDIKRYLHIISLKSRTKTIIKSEPSNNKHSISNEEFEERKKSAVKRKRSTSSDDDIDAEKKKHKKSKYKKPSSNDDSSQDERKSKKKHKKKNKKYKKSKKQKHEKRITTPTVSIEQLRSERLAREKREKLRTALLLAQKGISANESTQGQFRQKYNSQFFPELARQNSEKDYR